MKYLSPAKVNLTLAVRGVREDGYHELDSVVTPITLCDDVFLEKSTQTSFKISSATVDLSALPEDKEANLAVRALRLLEKNVGRTLPTAISIEKRIPLGGGLGGGSSNAATVLRGVNDLWELGLSTAQLCELGAHLGADVALFLLDGTVRMRGKGECVERLPLEGASPLTLVLANNGTHCATPQIYAALDVQRHKEKLGRSRVEVLTDGDELCDTMNLFLRKGDARGVAREVMNDLEAPCYTLFPDVGKVAEALKEAGCKGTLLCGSGATVCGIVETSEEGERVIRHPALANCRCAIVQTLPDGVMAAHGPLTPIVMVRIHVGQPCPSV